MTIHQHSVSTPATSDAPRPPLSDRMVELFIGLAVLGFGLLNSREKKKVCFRRFFTTMSLTYSVPQREKEVQDKTTKMIEDSLGDSAKEMVYVSLIATSPESQGRGYGGALMKTIILTVRYGFFKERTLLKTPFGIGLYSWSSTLSSSSK